DAHGRHAVDRNGAAAAGEALGHHVGIALHQVDTLDIDAEPGRGDLLQRRLVALAVGLVAGDEADRGVVVEHRLYRLRPAARAFLDIGRHADAAPLAGFLGLGAAAGEALPVGLFHALAHHGLEVAGVVGVAQRRLERDLARLDEVARPQLVRREPDLARDVIDEALDQVGCL